MSVRFRDEHPDRFGLILPGDYMPMRAEGRIHFVQASSSGGYPEPADTAACGQAMPDWKENPKAHPICGVVDCPRCLEIYRGG